MNDGPEDSKRGVGRVVVAGAVLLMVLLAVLLRPGGRRSIARTGGEMSLVFEQEAGPGGTGRIARPTGKVRPPATPEEIVANKVSQFARSRREICFALARKHAVEVPSEVERFFDAVEAGNWDESDTVFQSLWKQHRAEPKVPGIEATWPAILDAFGAAEQAHDWPAQKLLEYGNSIMSTLRPDMVYVGGTDPGRWIPALMNTSEGERHIVVTQNGLADPKYLEYVQLLYGDRFAALVPEDATAAQKTYLRDARRRLEQNQLRPGEDVRLSTGKLESGFTDGALQASGQVSVMAVNELLLNKLLENNPNLSFALEESFPMTSVSAEAAPFGPIMELRANAENPLTQERATESVQYWREQTQRLMADPEFTGSDEAKKSYSKLVSSQGGLLVQHNFLAEAEEAFRFANELCPYSPEAVYRYVNLLLAQDRSADAQRVANNAIAADPKNQQFRDLAAGLNKPKN